jgi:hypothetical protein
MPVLPGLMRMLSRIQILEAYCTYIMEDLATLKMMPEMSVRQVTLDMDNIEALEDASTF